MLAPRGNGSGTDTDPAQPAHSDSGQRTSAGLSHFPANEKSSTAHPLQARFCFLHRMRFLQRSSSPDPSTRNGRSHVDCRNTRSVPDRPYPAPDKDHTSCPCFLPVHFLPLTAAEQAPQNVPDPWFSWCRCGCFPEQEALSFPCRVFFCSFPARTDTSCPHGKADCPARNTPSSYPSESDSPVCSSGADPCFYTFRRLNTVLRPPDAPW